MKKYADVEKFVPLEVKDILDDPKAIQAQYERSSLGKLILSNIKREPSQTE